MVASVVITNILISLVLIYIARYLRKVTDKLALIADKLTIYESATDKFLARAPGHIYAQQENIINLHKKQQKLELQVLQIQQILTLMGQGWRIWQKLRGKAGGKSGKSHEYGRRH
jgi:hypothetical protein